jgi:hypothetical protein
MAFVTSFLVSPKDGKPLTDPNPFAGDERMMGARVVEGRLTDPTVPDEFTVNRRMAALLAQQSAMHVGDQFQVASFDQAQVAANAFDTGEPPRVPLFTATLVGVTENPTDFDDPSPTMVFSQAFLRAHPTVGVVQTIIATHLQPGTDPNTVMDAVHAMPNGADAYPLPARIVSADDRRAVRFQVTALWLVAAVTVVAAAVVVLQVISRTLRMTDDERSSLAALGWRPKDVFAERAVEGGIVAVIAAPVAAVLCFALTALFPLGVLRLFEPDSGPRVDWAITLFGIIATSVIILTGSALAVRRRSFTPEGQRVGRLEGALASSGAGMPMVTGAHLITSGPHGSRRSVTSLAAGAVGLAGLVACAVVGLTLTRIGEQPGRWGVNYDQLFGNPFVPTQNDIVTPIVANPDVVAVTGATMGSLTINGHDTATFAVDAVKGDLLPTTLKGRPPATGGEIGLGAEVARRLGVHVGDSVEAVGPTGTTRQVKVVGIVVTPDMAGDGATMTFSGYSALSPTATENIVLVRFRQGAAGDAAAKVRAANYSPPGSFVTPTSVRSLQRVTAAPYLLAIVLTVFLMVAVAYLLATSVSTRRRDLAVLRALGSDRRQLRAIVHWQATLMTVMGLLVGVPAGIVLSRWIVRLLTTALGIVPGAEIPPLLVLAFALAALAVANLLALLPAHRAARTRAADLMTDRLV